MRLIQLLHHLFKTDELALKANYLVNDAHANTAPPSPTRSSPRQLLTDGDRDLRLISNSRSIKTKENRAATVAATAQWLGRGRLRARGPPGGPGFSQRERACALHILPSSSSCGPVMCFLTWGRAGWSAGVSRTGPWVVSQEPGRIRNWKLHHLTQQELTALFCVMGCCLLTLLSEWLAWMPLWALCCYMEAPEGPTCLSHDLFYIHNEIW